MNMAIIQPCSAHTGMMLIHVALRRVSKPGSSYPMCNMPHRLGRLR